VPTPFETVRRGYDAIGGRYREWSHRSPVRLERVEALLRLLPTPGSLVLELGCGSGEPATRLLAERHRVVGIDASREQLRLAQVAAPTASLVQADMTNVAIRDGCLDAVASFYALGHVPEEEHRGLFTAVGDGCAQAGSS
jgi:ubiquinone/menaquinone biosynthesis C-methylase UbiE